MERVRKEDRELLRQALVEVLAEKYNDELAVAPEITGWSDSHQKAMERIIRQVAVEERKKAHRRWLVAILVAAALLLTACAAYVHRGEIRAFVEKVYDTYIHVAYHEGDEAEDNKKLEEFYTLGYVPEGYELVEQITTRFVNQYRWANDAGEYLIFEQHDLAGVNYMVNSEFGEIRVVTCGEYEVYGQAAGAATYVWNDGRYAYKIKSSVAISDDALNEMVNGLVAVK